MATCYLRSVEKVFLSIVTLITVLDNNFIGWWSPNGCR